MALNIIKLCVGVSDVDELAHWQHERLRAGGRVLHTTRMVPRRADEIVGKGSIYWVMKGRITCRQKITAIEPFQDDEGISRCHLVFDPELVAVRPQPRRAFQGWRYLKAEDSPADLPPGARASDIPEQMREELTELGLI